jgi:hypothetical protein
MTQSKGYTVVCEVGHITPRAEIAESGLTAPKAGELMLLLETGEYERFAGEKVSGIRVRLDDSVEYLPTDQFYDHYY